MQELVGDLIRDEGFKRHAYQDHLGYWTIGVGRLIDARRGGGLSDEEIRYLLKNDIARIEKDLDEKLPWWRELSERRQRALANLAFQLGTGGLLEFSNMLDALEDGDHAKAAEEALDSKWAVQTPQRAQRIATMIREG
jgi:lysozyme